MEPPRRCGAGGRCSSSFDIGFPAAGLWEALYRESNESTIEGNLVKYGLFLLTGSEANTGISPDDLLGNLIDPWQNDFRSYAVAMRELAHLAAAMTASMLTSGCLGRTDLRLPAKSMGDDCVANTECPEACIGGSCAQYASGGDPCDDSADCLSGYECPDGFCRGIGGTSCTGNDECVEVCIASLCDSRSGIGGPCDDTDDCNAGLDCSAGVCVATAATCGNGVRELGEDCDDNNTVTEACAYGQTSCAVCAADCTSQPGATSYCGDGIIDAGHSEICDDGNIDSGDGCTSTCALQTGWLCDAREPSRCTLANMVMVNAGTFAMGSPPTEQGSYSDEIQHNVTLTHDFSIWPTEITETEFQSTMSNWNPSLFSGCPNCPVENVSWYDAVAYANKLTLQQGGTPCYLLSNVVCVDATLVGSDYMSCMSTTALGIDSATVSLNNVASVYECTGFRLPTEAEWEYAARAGTTGATYNTAVNNGDLDAGHLQWESPNPVLDPIAWFSGNDGVSTRVAGSLAQNGWGLFDMLGNVWEWCWDWYGAYAAGPVADPEGPSTGPSRVDRGGSWSSPARSARAARRSYDNPPGPGNRSNVLGFRVVRTTH